MSWISPLAAKLNKAANMPKKVDIDSDLLLVEHRQKETDERFEFLQTSTPAFMYALKTELFKQVFALNLQLHQPSDRIQLHVDQEALQSLFITSNVEPSKRIEDEVSIEVSVSIRTREINENYRRHDEVPLKSEELWLYADSETGLHIASTLRSFNASEYACDLISRFLDERLVLREASAKKVSRASAARSKG